MRKLAGPIGVPALGALLLASAAVACTDVSAPSAAVVASLVPTPPTVVDLGIPIIRDCGRDLSRLWIIDRAQVLASVAGACRFESDAVIWQGGAWAYVSPAPPDFGSPNDAWEPLAINNRGQVLLHAFDPTLTPYYLWDGGVLTSIDLPPLSNGLAMNDVGQIVGVWEPAPGTVHAFLWEAGSATDLGELGVPSLAGFSFFFTALNNSGQATGAAFQLGVTVGFIWDLRNNPVVRGQGTIVRDINDLGVAVGDSIDWSTGLGGGFLWSDQEQLTLSGFFPMAINNLGQVGGGIITPDGRIGGPGVWQNGAITVLPRIGTVPDEVCDVQDIDNLGQVVGKCGAFHNALWATLREATPSEEIGILTTLVSNLVASGALNTSQAKNLQKKLNEALNDLAVKDTAGAIKAFRQFINQVTSLWQQDGVLTAAEAQPLIDAAQHAIDGLTT